MELKEDYYTGIILNDEEELNELIKIRKSLGWDSSSLTGRFSSIKDMIRSEHETAYVRVNCGCNYGTVENGGSDLKRTITLAEFKKEQSIMKYKAGDVLENRDGDIKRKVLGVCGDVYFISWENDFTKVAPDPVWTEEMTNKRGFSIKTEPTKTDKTVSQIEKELNLPAGTLNVVADK